MDAEALLAAFLDPATVKQATEQVKVALRDKDFMPKLLHQICHNPRPESRQLGAVLMRKKILKAWMNLTSEFRATLKETLLKRLVEEPVHIVRVGIAHVVSAVGKINISDWGEQLLNFLNECANSTNQQHREVSMIVFSSLIDNIGSELLKYFQQFIQVFEKGLKDTESMAVRLAALKGVRALQDCSQDPEHFEGLRRLLPTLVAVVKEGLDQKEEHIATTAMETLDEMVESGVVVQLEDLGGLVRFVLEIAKCTEFSATCRSQAMHFAHWVCKNTPKVVTRQQLVGPILAVLLPMAAEPEEFEDDEDEMSAHKIASQMADSLAVNLPCKHVYAPVLAGIDPYTNSANPHERKAALVLLGIISEGCESTMRKELPKLLPFVFTSFKDQNPSVRAAAATCFGQFAEYLQPEILGCHQQAMKVLLEVIDCPEPSVKEKVCYALEVFCDNLEDTDIEAYIDILIPKLMSHLLADGTPPRVRQTLILALSSTVLSSKEKVLPYAPTILQALEALMQQTDEAHLELRANATDCAGAVATAMGPEAFQPYFQRFVELTLEGVKTLQSHEIREKSFHFFGQLSFSMKEGFSILTNHVVTLAIASCESMEGIENEIDADLEELDDEDDDDSNAGNLCIRDGFVDEKVAALHLLKTIYRCSPSGIVGPFTGRVLEMIDSVSSYFHRDIRSKSLELLTSLVVAVHHANPRQWKTYEPGIPSRFPLHPDTKTALNAAWAHIFNMLAVDGEKEVVSEAFEAAAELVTELGPSFVEDNVKGLLSECGRIFEAKHVCQPHDEGIDEDEDSRAAEETLFDSVTTLIGAIAKVVGSGFQPMFDNLVPRLMRLAKHKNSFAYRSIGIGCFAEVLMSVGPMGCKYIDVLYPVALQGVRQTEDVRFRHNSAFCLGVLVQVGNVHPGILEKLPEILQALHPLFASSSEDTDAEHALIDNAASAVGRILMHIPTSKLPVDQMLPIFLSGLPLKEDFEEAGTILQCLVKIFHDPTTRPLLAPLMNDFIKVLVCELANPENEKHITQEVKQQVETVLKTIREQAGHQIFENALPVVEAVGRPAALALVKTLISLGS